MLIDLAADSLAAAALVILAGQFASLWIGQRLGLRLSRRGAGDETADSVGLVVGALLGLLAFTLAVTIGIAERRFEDRRAAGLNEANAIGTAWLRARALEPEAAAIATTLEAYARARLAWAEAARGSRQIEMRLAEAERLQRQLWTEATALARARPDAVTALLLDSLNTTFDMATTQRWAFRQQMPAELPWLLFALTVTTVGAIGLQWGLRRRWHPVLALMLLGARTGCLVLIADLSSPRRGAVRVDLSPYHWTIEGFGRLP